MLPGRVGTIELRLDVEKFVRWIERHLGAGDVGGINLLALGFSRVNKVGKLLVGEAFHLGVDGFKIAKEMVKGPVLQHQHDEALDFLQ